MSKENIDPERTVIAAAPVQEKRTCPSCGTVNLLAIPAKSYRCKQCKLEMAHLDYAPNGSVRGVFGWLRGPGEVAACDIRQVPAFRYRRRGGRRATRGSALPSSAAGRRSGSRWIPR